MLKLPMRIRFKTLPRSLVTLSLGIQLILLLLERPTTAPPSPSAAETVLSLDSLSWPKHHQMSVDNE